MTEDWGPISKDRHTRQVRFGVRHLAPTLRRRGIVACGPAFGRWQLEYDQFFLDVVGGQPSPQETAYPSQTARIGNGRRRKWD